jgi:hypothetical protein
VRRLIRIAALASAAAVILLGPATASAGAKGTDRPYRASGALTGPFDLATFEFDIVGPSVGTHYGQGPTHVAGIIGGPRIVTATAANGDTFTLEPVRETDASDVQCPSEWVAFSEQWVFTGGTGRFSAATGESRITGCILFDVPNGVLTVTFTAVGTINY